MSLMRSSTIDGVVRRSARAFGDRVALVFGEREWTYRELEEATSRAAAALLAQGLTKGDRVAAFGRNSDAYLLGFLACARAGLVHVPLNYNLTGYELEYLVTQSGSSLVLADPDLAPRLDDLEAPVPSLPLRDAEGSLHLGFVWSQDPDGGEKVPKGSTITLALI